MSESWYMHRQGQQHGPYSWEQLLSMGKEGKIGKDDLFWSASTNAWQKAEQIPGLMPPGGAPPPMPPKELLFENGLNYQVQGTVMPMLEIRLRMHQRMYAQSGAMKWMDQGINMEAEMKGGLLGALKRGVSGESLFIQNFTGLQDGATVGFGHSYPGYIIPVDVSAQPVICQRRAFLCAFDTVTYDIHVNQSLGSGFFGGEGFIMQKLGGHGMAFLEIDGECIEKTLEAGERIRVETGAVGAFEQSVAFNIERVKGIKNVLFGGEGLFVTILTGPGKVWLQTMPIQTMSAELYQYLPKPTGN